MNVWKSAKPPLVVSLVTTWNGGNVNASPKSWWTPISYDPAMLAVSVKTTSDTAKNIEFEGKFVLHVPPGGFPELTMKVLHTAKPLEYGKNELDDVGLAWQWITDPNYGEFAVIDGMPAFGCAVAGKFDTGDHALYVASILFAVLDEEPEIDSVLLHRGQNRFAHMGENYEVERY